MSLEAEQEDQGLAEMMNAEQDQQFKQEQEIQEEEVQLSPIEQKAWEQGWRPQEEFKGPEENWKTAKEFVKDGEWIAKINDLKYQLDSTKQEMNTRLDNANKLHEARRQQEISALKAQQRMAVDNADTESFDAAQSQIDQLEKEPTPEQTTPTEQSAKDPAIAAWESKNTWINDVTDERTAVANGILNSYLAQNPAATINQGLEHLDSRLEAMYPNRPATNPRRSQANVTETPTKRAKPSNKNLTMNDLTPEERQEWGRIGGAIFKGDEKAFLKAVADTRKG